MGLLHFSDAGDTLEIINDYEAFQASREALAGKQSEYKGYPWDELRNIKLEMLMILLQRSSPYPLFDQADYEWLSAEVLKRAVKTPYDFEKVFASSVKKLWKKRFPTDEAFHPLLSQTVGQVPYHEAEPGKQGGGSMNTAHRKIAEETVNYMRQQGLTIDQDMAFSCGIRFSSDIDLGFSLDSLERIDRLLDALRRNNKSGVSPMTCYTSATTSVKF